MAVYGRRPKDDDLEAAGVGIDWPLYTLPDGRVVNYVEATRWLREKAAEELPGKPGPKSVSSEGDG